MNNKIFTIGQKGEPARPFIVGPNQDYLVKTLGYVNKNDIHGESVIDPQDVDKVTIKQIGKLLDGSLVFVAKNDCDCGVHIEVFDK